MSEQPKQPKSLDRPEGYWKTRNIYWMSSTKDDLIEAGIEENDICEFPPDSDSSKRGMIQVNLTDEQAKKFIPEGTLYCYNSDGVCPFWDKIEQYPSQSNGFCHFLKRGDFTEPGTSLLWDQCKCCGVKDDWNAEAEHGEA